MWKCVASHISFMNGLLSKPGPEPQPGGKRAHLSLPKDKKLPRTGPAVGTSSRAPHLALSSCFFFFFFPPITGGGQVCRNKTKVADQTAAPTALHPVRQPTTLLAVPIIFLLTLMKIN